MEGLRHKIEKWFRYNHVDGANASIIDEDINGTHYMSFLWSPFHMSHMLSIKYGELSEIHLYMNGDWESLHNQTEENIFMLLSCMYSHIEK